MITDAAQYDHMYESGPLQINFAHEYDVPPGSLTDTLRSSRFVATYDWQLRLLMVLAFSAISEFGHGHVRLGREKYSIRPCIVTHSVRYFNRIHSKSEIARVDCRCKLACRASVEEWRQYNRYVRYQRASAEKNVKVSWHRYHLSVLFVDRYAAWFLFTSLLAIMSKSWE